MAVIGRATDSRVLAQSPAIIAGTTSFVGYLGPFYNDHFSAIRVGLNVLSETGTTPALAWAMEWQNPADLTWAAMLDHAGAAIVGVPFASTNTGLRYIDLLMLSALPGPDTDGVLIYGTNYKIYETIIPFAMRLALTLTGTGAVTKTYNAFVEGYVA